MGLKTTGPISGMLNMQNITAATTLTVEDSGKVFLLSGGTGVAITLPVPTRGLYYKFVITAVFATNYTVVSGTTDVMEGSILVAGAVVTVDAADQINFVGTAENIGDFALIYSDGTTWFVEAQALTAGAITATG